MTRLIVFVTVLWLFISVPSYAEDFYIQTGASGTGVSCGSPLDFSFFNSAGNWGAGTGKISPGDTVHVCGTSTVPDGATALRFQGGGTSGSPITLLFEPNAVIQAGYLSSDGGIICQNH